jgi:hypothetical protein
MTAVLPFTLYHATPLYRYDPKATDNHGIWDPAVHGQIKDHGLKPSMHSSKDVPVVFLTDEVGIATNYAECNRGEEWPVDWIVLAVDASVNRPRRTCYRIWIKRPRSWPMTFWRKATPRPSGMPE